MPDRPRVVGSLLRRLTEPDPAITGAEVRRLARLVALISLIGLPFSIVGALLARYAPQKPVVVVAAAVVALAVSYWLSRTRHYRLAAVLMTGIVTIMPFLAYLTLEERSAETATNSLIWTVLGVLFASLFFGIRGTLAVALAVGAGLLLMPGLDRFTGLFLASFIAWVSAAILVATYHRRQVQQDRLSELTAANQELDVMRASLERRVGERTAELAHINDSLKDRIAERETAEIALREAEAQFRTLVEQIPAITYIDDVDPANPADFKSLYLSPQFESWLGYSIADYQRDPSLWSVIVPAEDHQLAFGDGAYKVASVVDYRLVGRDGQVRWVRDDARVRQDPSSGRQVVQGVLFDITDLKQAEQSIRLSEERLQFIAWASNDAVWDWDLTTDEAWWNEGIQKLFHYPADTARHHASWWYENIHPDDVPKVKKSVKAAVDSDLQFWSKEYRFRRADGSFADVFDRGSIIRDPQGIAIRMLGSMMDITERKRMEEALREAEGKYRELVEQLPAVVYIAELGENGQWRYIGPQIQSLLGYTPQQWMADAGLWYRQLYPEDRERVLAKEVLDRDLSPGTHTQIEYRIFARDGRLLWVRDSAVVVAGSGNDSLTYHGVLTDITEQKQVEQALREAEGKYRTLVEQVPDVVYIAEIGANGSTYYVSPQIESLLGFSPREWIAEPGLWFDRMHPEDQQRLGQVQAEDRGREPGSLSVVEYRMHARDGRLVWVRDSATVIRGDVAEAALYHGVLTDITERKHAEQALQEANQVLTRWLSHSEQRSMQLGLLNEMSALLQNCRDINEACVTVVPIVRRLFSDFEIGLYTLGPGAHSGSVVAAWTDEGLTDSPFPSDDCWALRRRQLYLIDQDHPGPKCGHVAGASEAAYMCVPMVTQGEALALLHMPLAPLEPAAAAPGRRVIGESDRQLARTVADTMALALANIRLRETLREQSIRDSLTGLYNRRYMEESLEREIHRAARHTVVVGIIMCDIDHFKRFNDAYGHPAGDVLLRELGRVLRMYIRGADIACRYGGEEFTLILPEATLEVTRLRAEQIRQAAKRIEVALDGRVLPSVTVSAGVAGYPDHGNSGEEVLQASDHALYRAKREGRDRVVVR